jgi:hypothetical protein
MFVLLGFSLALVDPSLLFSYSSLLEWKCILCAIVFGKEAMLTTIPPMPHGPGSWHCILEVYYFCFDCYRGSQLRVCLVSQRRLWNCIFEQFWNCCEYGDTWRWTECFVHYEKDMSLLGVECYGLRRRVWILSWQQMDLWWIILIDNFIGLRST